MSEFTSDLFVPSRFTGPQLGLAICFIMEPFMPIVPSSSAIKFGQKELYHTHGGIIYLKKMNDKWEPAITATRVP